MTVHTYGFENGSNGAPITAALIGGTISVAGHGHFSTDGAMHGSLGVKWTKSDLYHRAMWSLDGDSKVAVRFYFKIGANVDASNLSIMDVHHTSRMASVTWKSDGRLSLIDSNLVAVGNSAVTVSQDTWYRAEIVLDLTAGAASFSVYGGDDTTAVGTKSDSSGLDFGTGPFDEIRLGPVAGSGWTTGNIYYDDVAWNPGGTTEIGPWTAPPASTFLRGIYAGGTLHTGASLRGIYAGGTLHTGASIREVVTNPSGGTGGDERPTGAGYVKYEDLYQSGDTVNDALARLTEPAVITFPEGAFEVTDFAVGGHYGIHFPEACTGIWGSGKGALGEDSGTIFRVKANTATHASPAQDNSTPNPFTVIYHSPNAAAVYRNFHVEGTDQRSDLMYNNLVIYGSNGSAAVDVEDILLTGWAGNSGAPPGETFGMTIHARNNHTVKNVTFDGRRSTNGPLYGLTGGTAQNCVGGTWTDCKTMHVRNAAFVLYQTFNVETHNWVFIRDASDVADPSQQEGAAMNHERTSGTIHHSPSLTMANSHHGVHFTHSNPSGGATYDGTYRSWDNGTLTVIDCPVRPNADIWENGKLTIQTWDPYDTGETNVDPPTVQSHTTPTVSVFDWVHGNPSVHTDVDIEII